jgi:tetratricopeptide (TPR) repeat protein
MQEDLSRYKLTEWLKKSAKALAIKSLKEQKCEFAIDLLSEYNMTIGQKYDEDLFWCYLKSGMFDKAKKIIDQNIDSRDLSKKLKWLYLALQYYKSQDDNKKVILVANDILKLEKSLNKKKYDDVLYDIANAYYNLRDYDDLMLETVKKIEKEFPDYLRNIDLYMKVVHYGQKKKDDLLIVNYAKKVIDLEKKYKVQAYSPQIEILYAHELQKIGKYRGALNVVLDLLTHKLTDAQKAEVLYLAGELSLKLGQKDAATEFYTKCGEIVKDSAWQKLCAENLEILSE